MKKILLAVIVIISFGVFALASFNIPYVSQIDPAQEYNQVTFNAPFTIHFSHLMNKASVEEAFAISPTVAGDFKWKDGKTLEFHPSRTLRVGDEYRLTIKGAAKSLWMKQMTADTILKYVVSGPPFVLFHDPDEGAVLRADEVITVMFDRPMAFVEIPAKDLVQSEPKIKGSIRYVGMSAVQFIPASLKPDQEYTITIPGGLPALDGGKTKEATQFNVQTPSLRVSQTVPVEGAEVGINQALEIKFDQAVDLNQIRPGKNVLLFPSNDLDAAISQKRDGFFNTEVRFGTDDEGNKLDDLLIFTPSFPYQYNQDYEFMLKADEALSLEEDFELRFRTIPDPDAPETEEVAEEEVQIVPTGLAWESEGMEFFVRGENPRLRLLNQVSEEINIDACQISSNDYLRISSGKGFDSYLCETNYVSLNTEATVINLNDHFKLDWVTGVYFASINTEEEKIWKIFLVEDTSLLLKKTDAELLVWASDIKSGEPIPEMEIEVLSFDGTDITTGITDETGVYQINKPFEEGIYVRARKEEENKTRWALASDQWTLGEDIGNAEKAPEIYLVTNQNSFAPGETIQLKGIWRQVTNHRLSPPESRQVVIRIEDDFGNEIINRRIALRRNGSFDTAIDLPNDSIEGSYQIILSDINNQTVHAPLPIELISEDPSMELQWTMPKDHHAEDQAPVYILTARHINGLPAAKVKGQYRLYQKPAALELQKGATSYKFSQLDAGCQQNCLGKRLVKEEAFVFDLDGVARFILTDMNDEFLDSGYEYELVAEALSNRGLSSFAQYNFTIHQGEFDLGLGLRHAIVEINATVEAEVVALKQNGDALEDQKVNVVLIDSKGKRVFKKSLTTGRTQTEISIPLGLELEEGVYLLRAEATDESANDIVSEQEIYLISEMSPALSSQLMLASDQDKYFLGGRAHLIISEAEAAEDNPVPVLVTYERDGLLGYERVDLVAPITKITVPIEERMLPHFITRVTRFNRGLLPSYESDSVRIDVEDDASVINLDFSFDPVQPEPGDELTVTINSYDYQNRPVPAVITFSALQGGLNGDVLSNEHFFPAEPHQIQDASNLGMKRVGTGEPTEQVTMAPFVPVPSSVYFNPLLQTDESGTAEVTFVLPEERRDLYLIASATKDVSQFGHLSQNLKMNQVLSIKPILPSFVSPGDQTVFAALVTNVSDEIISSHIELETNQAAIRGDAGRNISLKPGQHTEVNFNVFINQNADADYVSLKFSSDKDFLAAELPLKHLESSLDLVENGLITDIWSGRIISPADAFPGSGKIEFSMSGSPINLAHVYAQALEAYPHDSTYYLASKLIAKAALAASDEGAKQSVGFLTSSLLKRADAHGSYAFWNAERPSSMLTAYVASAYKKAQESGVNVDSTKLNQTLSFLWGTLNLKIPLDDQLNILWALGEHEQYDTERTLTLFKEREQVSLMGQAFLLMNLEQLKDAGQTSTVPFLERLKSEIVASATQRDGLVSFEDEPLLTAVILYALASLDATNPILKDMANYLISEKTDIRTRFNPKEAVWTILALSEMSKAAETTNINYITQIKLNGSVVMDQSVTSSTQTDIYQATRKASVLSTEEVNDLFVQKDGIGPLYFDAHMISYLNPELIMPVEDGVIITRSYFMLSDDGSLSPADSLKKGVDYVSHLELIVPRDLDYVAITDPVPAGIKVLEAIELDSVFDEARIEEYGISYFANHLPAGVYQVDSLVQPNLSGTYQHLPASIQAIFDPDTFARTIGGTLQVTD